MSRTLAILATITLTVVIPSPAAMFFDVSVDTTSLGPPYPTSPTQMRLYEGDLPNPSPAGLLNMGIYNSTDSPLGAYMRAWDPAGGPGTPSSSASFDVFLDPSQPVPSPATSSFMDIWLQALTSSGEPGGRPAGSGGFSIKVGGGTYLSAFDLSVNVVTDGGAPRLLKLHGEVHSGQPAYFSYGSSVQFGPEQVHIIPKLVFAGPVDSALPLFTATLTPEPASLLLMLSAVGLFRRAKSFPGADDR